MQHAKQIPCTEIIDSLELICDQLLGEIHGEVLLIRSTHSTTICKRSAKNMRRQALSWLYLAGTENDVSFIAGRVSDKGGRFQIIKRNQAVELIAMWIIEEMQHGMDPE